MDAERLINVTGQKARNLRIDGGTDISQTALDDVRTVGLRVHDANLSGTTINNCNLTGLRVTDCKLDDATVDGVSLAMALAATTGEPDLEKRAQAFTAVVTTELFFNPAAFASVPSDLMAEDLCAKWYDAVLEFMGEQTAGVRGEVADCWRAADQWGESASRIRHAARELGLARDLGWDYAGRDLVAGAAALVVLTVMLDMVAVHPGARPH